MLELIRDIINRFGGRYAGTVQEKQAQLYYKSLLEKFCDSVFMQEFDVPVAAKFESLKIFCIVFYISILLFLVSPLAAFLLSLLNALFYLMHFVTYHNWLDFLFSKQKSTNVIGAIEPLKEVKSTIIFSGHMDSTKEFIWWYRLGHPGMVLTVFSGVLFALYPLFCGVSLLFPGDNLLLKILWWLFLILSPVTIVLFKIHGKNIIQGAQDNLSGVAIATAVGKYFSENKLQHTRVRIISFGSEEPGLRGSEAYAKKFREELKRENAICINLDGIKDADKLHIFSGEVNVHARYPKWLVHRLEGAFEKNGISFTTRSLPIGATDGVSFVRQGIPAVTIIGQSTDKLDPTYHTRLDIPECINPQALEDTLKVLKYFAEEWDRGEHQVKLNTV